MAHNVADAKRHDRYALNPFQPRHRVGKPGDARLRQIDLTWIAADHHPAPFAKAGEEHFHLRDGRVLRLVQHDESV